jgi:hypothetical protein
MAIFFISFALFLVFIAIVVEPLYYREKNGCMLGKKKEELSV